MCGRYNLVTNAEAVRRLFKVEAFDERLVTPRYNIAPTQPIVIVREERWGRDLIPVRWGLIPAWTKDPNDARLLINARAEGIAEKPSFRNAFRYRRCLIPASGFYEWQVRGKGAKQAFRIHSEAQQLIAFAGLWETWAGADGSEIDTAAIVTVPCNARLSTIHNRMPALIDPENFSAWLSSETDAAEAAALLKSAPEGLLACAPISSRINSAANDDSDLWEEIVEAIDQAGADEQRSLFRFTARGQD